MSTSKTIQTKKKHFVLADVAEKFELGVSF